MILLCSIVDFLFAFANGSINPFYLVGGLIALLALKNKPWRLVYFIFCSLQAVLLVLGTVGRWYYISRAAAAGIVLLICFKVIVSYKFYEKE